MAANKVFIVEDDAVIARAVAAHLTTWQMCRYSVPAILKK